MKYINYIIIFFGLLSLFLSAYTDNFYYLLFFILLLIFSPSLITVVYYFKEIKETKINEQKRLARYAEHKKKEEISIEIYMNNYYLKGKNIQKKWNEFSDDEKTQILLEKENEKQKMIENHNKQKAKENEIKQKKQLEKIQQENLLKEQLRIIEEEKELQLKLEKEKKEKEIEEQRKFQLLMSKIKQKVAEAGTGDFHYKQKIIYIEKDYYFKDNLLLKALGSEHIIDTYNDSHSYSNLTTNQLAELLEYVEILWNEKMTKTITTYIEAFKKEKSQRKLKQAVECNLNQFRLAQLNERRGVEFFFKNMTYDNYLGYSYLNLLYDEKLWDFKEDELKWFRIRR